MKKDDSSLPATSERAVHKYADLLLRKASAYDRFPTPVGDLVTAAKLEVARESALAHVGLDAIYRALPNALKLAPDKLKRAAAKLLGLLDRADRAIHLDPISHPKRKLYVTVHEIAHDFLPHQRETYAIVEDSEAELDAETSDLYEREANCFASEVLFQIDRFTKEAADFMLGIKVPVQLSKKYGPSVYSAARRYVVQHHSACALVVYNRPVCLIGIGEVIELRRAVYSPAFEVQFGRPNWPAVSGQSDFFYCSRPRNRFTAPRPFRITDLNGTNRPCTVEAFDTTHQLLFLVYPETACGILAMV